LQRVFYNHAQKFKFDAGLDFGGLLVEDVSVSTRNQGMNKFPIKPNCDTLVIYCSHLLLRERAN